MTLSTTNAFKNINRARELSEQRHAANELPTTQNIFQLPLWGQDKRAVPNELIRSALFTVANHRTKREFFKSKPIVVIGDGELTYTGEELRQDDEDIWLEIIFLFREQHVENFIEFAPYSLLRELGWPQTTQYKQKLRDCLERMSANSLNIFSKRLQKGLSVSLVRKFMWNNESGNLKKWRVWIEPEVQALFDENHCCKLRWEYRKKLNPLAKWLYSYYASHAKPYAIKVATLYSGCGSRSSELRYFKRDLRKALTELVTIGFLEDFFIDAKNLVHVTRKALAALGNK